MEETGEERPKWGTVAFQRRRFPRIDVTLPAVYGTLAEGSGGAPIRMGTGENIGEGGLLLILPEYFPESTRLSLTLYLPAASGGSPPLISMDMEVTVAWTELRTGLERNEYRCGVSFNRIDPQDLEKIRAFVREQMER